MRYILLVIAMAAMAACGVPPIDQKAETAIPVSPVVEVKAPRNEPKAMAPPKVPGALEGSPCAGIDTGDIKETIKNKLDCISEHNK